ncbi:hypothetical protein EOM09_02115 [bacterium]|nr:hypothetical protein [bacterium]
MRKTFTLLLLVLITTMFSLTAKSITVRIAAYVPERITFEQTEDSFSVNTNMSNIEYGFYGMDGSLTDAQSADVLAITAL